jgi:hypothetical protein
MKPLVIDSFAGGVRSFGNVPSELPDRHRGEHIPDARMQKCCDGARQFVAGAYRQLQRLSKDQQAAEYRKRGRDGAGGNADELARLHSSASDVISRGCPVSAATESHSSQPRSSLMVECTTITREMIEAGAACRPHTQVLSVLEAFTWKQIASCVEQFADFLCCARDDVRTGDIVGVFGQEALRRFCNPDLNLIHHGKPARPLTTQVSICKHQVRRACEEKSNPVRLLCCGRRQSILERRVVRQIVCHRFLTRIYLAYRSVADAILRATFQTAYFNVERHIFTKRAQLIGRFVWFLTVMPSLTGGGQALATGGARG